MSKQEAEPDLSPAEERASRDLTGMLKGLKQVNLQHLQPASGTLFITYRCGEASKKVDFDLVSYALYPLTKEVIFAVDIIGEEGSSRAQASAPLCTQLQTLLVGNWQTSTGEERAGMGVQSA